MKRVSFYVLIALLGWALAPVTSARAETSSQCIDGVEQPGGIDGANPDRGTSGGRSGGSDLDYNLGAAGNVTARGFDDFSIRGSAGNSDYTGGAGGGNANSAP